MKKHMFLSSALLGAILLFASSAASRAQWVTQNFALKAGWNAVYLHVDASHVTLDTLVGADASNPIEEIWLWRPDPSVQQFITSPQTPTAAPTWASWARNGSAFALQRLIGNASYLVRVRSTVPAYTWQLQGHPLPPQYQWTTTGLNLLGFPTPATLPPNFESFLAKAPELQQTVEIYGYQGGDLSSTNPARIYNLRTRPVNRGEAFWLRSGDLYNRYFGPFEISLEGSSGVHFGDSLGQYRLRIRNTLDESSTVSLRLWASETPPAGQESISGLPPVLVRGARNMTNLTYAFSDLNAGPQSWNLAPKGAAGSEVEITLGLNRFAMTGSYGSLYAGILRLTDASGLSQVDVPVSARVASRSGLWVGQAQVNQVRQYIKSYLKNTDGTLLAGANGAYTVTGVNTNLGSVAQPYPVRLIVHSDASGTNASLLQRVYYGLVQTNLALTTRESLLDADQLSSARRLTATHLPWSAENRPWSFTGAFQQGSAVSAVVNLAYDDQTSNPFLHTYHPDHDNLDATFKQKLPQGVESYSVERRITLNFTQPGNDFDHLTGAARSMVGEYQELVTMRARGSEQRQFEAAGQFALTRLTDIPTLTIP